MNPPPKIGSPAGQRPPLGPGLPPHLDPLTLVLEGVRLRCMIPSAHEMTAPWGLRFGALKPEELRQHLQSLGVQLPPRTPPAHQGGIIAFLRGSGCLEVPNESLKLPLAAGDVVLITRRQPFILRDTWRSPVVSAHQLIGREQVENLRGLRHGGGGVACSFLLGGFHLEDQQDHPILDVLPPVIHIRAADPDAAPWLDATLRGLAAELASRLPGSAAVVNHLAHVLFIQAVRAHAAALPQSAERNWFHALFDPDLSTALGLIHARPEEPWTVASLAQHACASRSAFSARFTALVGQPPLKYLTDCRMRKARDLLRNSRLPIKAIAARVGYSNESAFSNAFKRHAGQSPAAYRREQAPPAP